MFNQDLLPPMPPLNADQAKAVDTLLDFLACGDGRLSLTGPAGTGKTTILRALNEGGDLGSMIMWTGMTGKAAARMREAAGVPATTLHSILYWPPGQKHSKSRNDLKFTQVRDPEGKVLVIDEASMVTPAILDALDYWINNFGVKVLFVGDSYQLPPVLSKEEEKQVGKGDYSVFAVVKGPVLSQVMRNGDDILTVATLLRVKGELPPTSRGSYEFLRDDDVVELAVERYLADMDDHGLITWTNQTRMAANWKIRNALGYTEIVPQPGEPILVCKNGPGGTVLNGEVYTIGDMEPGPMLHTIPTWKITTTCGKPIHAVGHNWVGQAPYFEERDDWMAYRKAIRIKLAQNVPAGVIGADRDPPEPLPVTYGHVLTAHRAQGSEFRRVTVFLPKRDTSSSHWKSPTTLPGGGTAPFNRRWIYTAISRAKARCTVLMGT
jgi:hypothetical protein